jgi:cysteine desulfurase/selenocysteine lyase
MIRRVGRTDATWNDLPWKFEAGTPAIAEAVGLGAAVDYLQALGMESVWAHERSLTAYALQRLFEMPGVCVIGPPADQRSGVISFTVDGIHPHDLAHVLDLEGVAVRAGTHCAHPLHDRFGLAATARASLYLYNTRGDVDRLIAGIKTAQEWFEAMQNA